LFDAQGGSLTLEVEGIQQEDRTRDSVGVTFDGSSSTSIFNMNDLMSVVDQIGKTVTIVSPKKDDTPEEVSISVSEC
jgi:hypothetical protein